MHLLDANVLITAHNLYYPIGRFPEFWDWLVHMGEAGEIKVPVEILEEITEGSEIGRWLSEADNYSVLRLDEDVDPALVQAVIEKYAPDLNDAEVIEIGRDPFLIAYAMALPANRIVVTVEASKPSAKRANRRIPDVCKDLGVKWCNSFEMMTALNFTTAWRSQI
ncbi:MULTISPECIES: DUF4411 family protein [Rhizobiaceae]|uniref:Uncharacterized protein DUF4411 n=1 Tax=Sinorhizobium americanum TaxID=194963 RepID=A0A4R2BMN7_9HYPH|nr:MULTISPECIES: DUF4411 family protein [Rhizobiaceae]PDT33884.1 DNA-binding protein [Rhizobium sp. M10]TCN28647.1 uncharacterized protein DUF4411 [Sinorhizobium americanum]